MHSNFLESLNSFLHCLPRQFWYFSFAQCGLLLLHVLGAMLVGSSQHTLVVLYPEYSQVNIFFSKQFYVLALLIKRSHHHVLCRLLWLLLHAS